MPAVYSVINNALLLLLTFTFPATQTCDTKLTGNEARNCYSCWKASRCCCWGTLLQTSRERLVNNLAIRKIRPSFDEGHNSEWKLVFCNEREKRSYYCCNRRQVEISGAIVQNATACCCWLWGRVGERGREELLGRTRKSYEGEFKAENAKMSMTVQK